MKKTKKSKKTNELSSVIFSTVNQNTALVRTMQTISKILLRPEECPNCGAIIEKKQKICEKCGIEL